jgi:hypothetical protein
MSAPAMTMLPSGKQENETMPARVTRNRGEEGFALILALLALMLLTFLGLTLATTTSTELQIATNYRWSQQALYNAEAGVEVAKVLLRDQPGNWSTVLPQPRGLGISWYWDGAAPTPPSPPGGLASTDSQGRALRHWENANCDGRGGRAGYGVVLNAQQYVSSTMGHTLNGAFTLWVRRGVIYNTDGTIQDDDNDNALVLTSEGVAPYIGTQVGSNLARRNAASRTLEVTLVTSTSTGCENYKGQAGGGVSGSGFWKCGVLGGNTGGCAAASGLASVGQARRGATQTIGGTRVATDDAGTLCDTGVR